MESDQERFIQCSQEVIIQQNNLDRKIKSVVVEVSPDRSSASITPIWEEAPFNPDDYVEVQRPEPDTYVNYGGYLPHTDLCCYECRSFLCNRGACPDRGHGPQSCHAHHDKTFVWTEL